MRRFPGLRRLVRIDRGAAGIGKAVDDELQFHFDMTVRELMANGMQGDDARKAAMARFGDVQRTRERLADIDRARAGHERRAEWWSAFAQDLRYALRGLRRKPGFAAAVIVTFGLGIGANATMFSIVDRLLFRPPAFLIAPNRATRLYLVRSLRDNDFTASSMGHRRYLDLKEGTTSFDAMTPFYVNNVAVGTGDATREMHVGISGADLWRMFAVHPVIGRFFTAAEDVPPDGARVAVLSYAFWQTQFGGRNSALGERIDIGPAQYTVIGVAPEGFDGFSTTPVVAFVPHAAYNGADGRSDGLKEPWYDTYHMTWFTVFARRKPGVSAAAATADLTRAYINSYRKQVERDPGTTTMQLARPRALAGPVLANRGPNEGNDAKVATWLLGVAAIVLLIACANVTNLLLARALRRRREIAVRVALGVSRMRLLMQLITESLLLAALGGVAGLAVAQVGGGVMQRALLDSSLTVSPAFTDSRLLAVVAALAALAGLLTGIAPVLQTRRHDVSAVLKAGAREGTVQRSRVRAGLLIGQAALSVVLLVGAGLFLRSLVNVKNVRMGYDADRLLYVSVNSRGVKSDSVHDVALRQALLDRSKRVPGIDNAALALTVPFWSTWDLELFVAGIDSVAKLGEFTLQAASPEFFATMGTRIISGRGISAEDREHAPRVMVVSKSMADKLWPAENAIGKCVRISADTMPCTTVVGVAEDVRRQKIGETETHYYLPAEQFRPSLGGLFARTHGAAPASADDLRRALQALMPGAAYVTVTPMSTIIEPSIRAWRVGAIMFAIFGMLALVLAAIGLYSVIAYNVTQRTYEMGVRVALGAQARDVITLIVREGLTIVIPGVVLGGAIALGAGKWVAPLLFNVSPKDPVVLAAVVTTLVAVAVAASWIPARRAAGVDANEALRAD